MKMAQDLGKKVNKNKKVRSAGYPALDLGSAVLAAQKIFGDLGQGPHSRPSLARGFGYKNFCGPASAKIGALVHFGLLERFGGGYSITDLAKTIFGYPQNDCQKEMFAAAAKPALFSALAARFAGEMLPNNLAAILIGDYKISSNAAPLAAKNFLKTMEIVGLIKENRLVLPDDSESETIDVAAAANEYGDDKDKKNPAGFLPPDEKIEVKLDSGIVVLFPKKLASRLALGEFAPELKNLDSKSAGLL